MRAKERRWTKWAVLILALCLCLCACGRDNVSTSPDAAGTGENAAPGDDAPAVITEEDASLSGSAKDDTANPFEIRQSAKKTVEIVDIYGEGRDAGLLVRDLGTTADDYTVSASYISDPEEPQVGDVLIIEYDGIILETYPGQFNETFDITYDRTPEGIKRHLEKEPVLYDKVVTAEAEVEQTMICSDWQYLPVWEKYRTLTYHGRDYRLQQVSLPEDAVTLTVNDSAYFWQETLRFTLENHEYIQRDRCYGPLEMFRIQGIPAAAAVAYRLMGQEISLAVNPQFDAEQLREAIHSAGYDEAWFFAEPVVSEAFSTETRRVTESFVITIGRTDWEQLPLEEKYTSVIWNNETYLLKKDAAGDASAKEQLQEEPVGEGMAVGVNQTLSISEPRNYYPYTGYGDMEARETWPVTVYLFGEEQPTKEIGVQFETDGPIYRAVNPYAADYNR